MYARLFTAAFIFYNISRVNKFNCELGENMTDLLMIADDLTGALDSGVALAKKGIATEVLVNADLNIENAVQNHRAVVVNTATRHMDAEQAYCIVHSLCKKASALKIPILYKKTDSALRGNIGAELEAVLDATQENVLHFAPAFPKMNRFTKAGHQYIGDIPISESEFASDILNPITDSYIPNIIAKQSDIPVLMQAEANRPQMIRLYNAKTDQELNAVAKTVFEQKKSVLAGCAGFAEAVADVLKDETQDENDASITTPLVVLCGSVHPVSKAQLNYAAERGMKRFWITSAEVITPGYWDSEAGKALLQEIQAAVRQGTSVLAETSYYQEVISTEEKNRIAAELPLALGNLARQLLESEFTGTLVIFGGDMLGGFVNALGIQGIEPIRELKPGVVLASATWNSNRINFVTKAGSFGDPDLLVDLAHME